MPRKRKHGKEAKQPPRAMSQPGRNGKSTMRRRPVRSRLGRTYPNWNGRGTQGPHNPPDSYFSCISSMSAGNSPPFRRHATAGRAGYPRTFDQHCQVRTRLKHDWQVCMLLGTRNPRLQIKSAGLGAVCAGFALFCNLLLECCRDDNFDLSSGSETVTHLNSQLLTCHVHIEFCMRVCMNG